VKDQDFLIKVGGNISRIRKSKDWTVQELADEMDTDKSNVIAYEKGRKNMTLITVLRFAKALGVHPKDLLNF
jgi:transcriptional regulator with XRE-family HTH domain